MKKSTALWVYVNFLQKPALIIFLCLFAFGACKKDEEDAPSPASPTKTQMLTDKTWRMTASTVSPAMMGMTNIYAMMANCEKDNTFKYNADASKSFVLDEGASKCSSMDPQSVTGSWQLSSNESTLTTTVNSQTETYTLVSISSTSLSVTYTMDMSGVTYTITNSYSNQ